MTYDELTTKLREYTETSSTVLTSTIINDFISDAEYRIMTDVDLDVFRQTREKMISNDIIIDINKDEMNKTQNNLPPYTYIMKRKNFN